MWRGPFAYGQATADRTLLMWWILGVGTDPVLLGHHAGVAGARAQGFRAASAALYSSLRLSPVAAATSAVTSLSRSPAATRSWTARSAESGSAATSGAPPTTMVISPRTPSAAHPARARRTPRRTSW